MILPSEIRWVPPNNLNGCVSSEDIAYSLSTHGELAFRELCEILDLKSLPFENKRLIHMITTITDTWRQRKREAVAASFANTFNYSLEDSTAETKSLRDIDEIYRRLFDAKDDPKQQALVLAELLGMIPSSGNNFVGASKLDHKTAFDAPFIDSCNALGFLESTIRFYSTQWRRPKYLSPYAALIQSSGVGKSRMLVELSRQNRMLGFFACLRPGDGVSGYPKNSAITNTLLAPAELVMDLHKMGGGISDGMAFVAHYMTYMTACIREAMDFAEVFPHSESQMCVFYLLSIFIIGPAC